MVTYIEYGDIFHLNGVTSYAHGCNCAGAMGKGIALQFKHEFPDMYKEYNRLCREKLFHPGDVYDYFYGEGHVYNLGTQVSWRTKAAIPYIEQSVRKMLEMATSDQVKAIALPAIGAGLGGLQWQEVKNILDTVSIEFPLVHLYVVEKYKPTK